MLEKRLRRANLMREWKAFAAFAVGYLGMPSEAMPLYDPKKKWVKKAQKISSVIINGFSKNRVMKSIQIARIFPANTIAFLPAIFYNVNSLKLKELIFSKEV